MTVGSRSIGVPLLLTMVTTAWVLLRARTASAEPAFLLPEGIGLIQVGVRHFDAQSQGFNGEGRQVPLADKSSLSLSGANLEQGKGGADLRRLVEELHKIDGSDQPGSLAKSLDLGTVRAHARAQVDAKFFGLAYGATRWLTLFAGVPWIDARVDTELTIDGPNNASAIKDRAGALAFEQVRSGLDRASQISPADIKANFASYGYRPIDSWSTSGPGDVTLGAKTAIGRRIGSHAHWSLGLTTSLDVPTAYAKDPNNLTDVNLGKGYYSLTSTIEPRLGWRWLFASTGLTFGQNFDRQVQRRVPVADEALVAPERTSAVTLHPGQDTGAAVAAGFYTGAVTTLVRQGMIRHAVDRYSGPLEGNYDSLAEGSDSTVVYREIEASISTARAYQKSRFPVPVVVGVRGHDTTSGINAPVQRYYELTISTFFSTPAARP